MHAALPLERERGSGESNKREKDRAQRGKVKGETDGGGRECFIARDSSAPLPSPFSMALVRSWGGTARMFLLFLSPSPCYRLETKTTSDKGNRNFDRSTRETSPPSSRGRRRTVDQRPGKEEGKKTSSPSLHSPPLSSPPNSCRPPL